MIIDLPSRGSRRVLALSRSSSYCGYTVLLSLCFAAVASTPALGQRPVHTFDPFYRGETAARTFYDRYAVTGEISYRPAGLLQGDGVSSTSVPSTASDPFGISLHLDYRLATGLDLGVFIDASGNTAGRSLSLNWLALKYYRRQENVDYAIRLAVDPVSDGRSGFPQTDLAFLYTSTLSSSLKSDFAVGIRRVQLGFQQIESTETILIGPEDPIVSSPGPDRQLRRTRAHGWEVHMMTGYQVLFDPAGSNLFVSLIAEGGRYDLVDWVVVGGADDTAERNSTTFHGGVVWARSGLQFARPGYQLSPFLTLPIKQWVPSNDDYPRARPHIGLRLMLR